MIPNSGKHALLRGLSICLTAVLLSACAAGNRKFDIPPGAQDPLTEARADVETGSNTSAILKLTTFLRDNPGSALVDEAKFLRGRAYLAAKDRVLAADDFQRVLSDYPQSRYAAQSSYLLAVCYDGLARPSQLDQDWTDKAIGAYRGFAARYPDRPEAAEAKKRAAELTCRLGKKAYENGILYLRMNALEASRIYFRKSMNDYPDCEWACRSSIGLGEADIKSRRWADAIEHLGKAANECSDAGIKEKARKLMDKAREGMAETAESAAEVPGQPDSSRAQ